MGENGPELVVSVAPRAGAWIEAYREVLAILGNGKSLPVRERGLKHVRWAICHQKNVLSLPVRERGLKHVSLEISSVYALSLPVRERGLKPTLGRTRSCCPASLPVRERGLKLAVCGQAQG